MGTSQEKLKVMKLFSILLGGSAASTTDEYTTTTTTTTEETVTWSEPWDYGSYDPIYSTSTTTVISTTSTGFYDSCGGEITKMGEIFTSPRYPSYYPPFARCTWNINLGENKAFRIVPRAFDVRKTWRAWWDGSSVQYQLSCYYDHVTVIANGDERVFCGGNNDQHGRSDPDKDLDEFENEEDGKLHDYDLSKVEDGFPIHGFVVPSGSAVGDFQSNWHISGSGFEFEIAELTRLQLIEIHLQRIFDSLPKKVFGYRYKSRMERTLAQLNAAYTGDSCYEENGFGDEAADVTVFDKNDMCNSTDKSMRRLIASHEDMLVKDEARSIDKSSDLREKLETFMPTKM